jgi:hypothetical protein
VSRHGPAQESASVGLGSLVAFKAFARHEPYQERRKSSGVPGRGNPKPVTRRRREAEAAAGAVLDSAATHGVKRIELYRRQCELLLEWRQSIEHGSVTKWKKQLAAAWGKNKKRFIERMLTHAEANPSLWDTALARARTFGRVDLSRTPKAAKPVSVLHDDKLDGPPAPASGATGASTSAPAPTAAVPDADIPSSVVPDQILSDAARESEELKALAARAATLARDGLELVQQAVSTAGEEAAITAELREVQRHFCDVIGACEVAKGERDAAVRKLEDMQVGMDQLRAELTRLRSAAPTAQACPSKASSAGTPKPVPFQWPKAKSMPVTVDAAWKFFGIKSKRAKHDDIKDMWNQTAKAWHPDLHPNDEANAKLHTQRLNVAYETLKTHCGW